MTQYCMTRSEFEPQAHALVAEWQKRLRLQDWKVDVRFGDDKWLEENDNAFGRNHIVPQIKEAIITLADTDHAKLKDAIGCKDLEVTLVHELLHLLFEGFDIDIYRQKKKKTIGGYYQYNGMEQSIELIAQALIQLKRESLA